MLKALKTYEVLTNTLLIYKWALCQVSFEYLTIIGALKTLYAGTKPLVLDRSESVIIAEDIYNFVLFRKRMSLQNKPHFDLIQSPL